MRTLYLHGLDSHPTPEKNEIMKNAGLELTALHISYREKLGVYETMKDTAIRKKIEFIIGSSLGGYIGNLLAEDLGIPCLLFNPAMHYTDVFYSKMPVIETSKVFTRPTVKARPKLIDGSYSMGGLLIGKPAASWRKPKVRVMLRASAARKKFKIAQTIKPIIKTADTN